MSEKKSYFDERNDTNADDAFAAVGAESGETMTSRAGATALRWVLTLAVLVVFGGFAWLLQAPVLAIVGVLVSAALFSCMHVVLEWERTVVLRFGKFNRVAGPGLIFMIPLVEYSAATVDMRMRSTAKPASPRRRIISSWQPSSTGVTEGRRIRSQASSRVGERVVMEKLRVKRTAEKGRIS